MGRDVDFTEFASESWQILRPGDDMTTFEVAMRVRRLALILNDRLDRVVAELGLSVFGDYEVLAAIRREDRPLQPSTIADSLKLTRAGITGRLNRLEDQGLVERQSARSDARSVLVSLTAAGRRSVDEAFAALHDERAALFEPLTRTQQRNLSELLRKVLAPVDDAMDVGTPPD